MMAPPLPSPAPVSDLLGFHRPRPSRRPNLRAIPHLKAESKRCLRNLAAYRTSSPKITYPRSRCAAVLIALFIGRLGDVYVLLSRRSSTLRSYAGDTSLPGGKVEPDDKTIEDTARREAWEEIGLPRDRQKVPLLCMLEPFLSSNDLIVTPVVVLITDYTLRPILNSLEVVSIFSHPLAAFLTSEPAFASEPELVEMEYHTYRDVDWHGRGLVRAHQFLTGREAGGIKPIFGLTAVMLIRTAVIGYGHEPDFEVHAPNGPLPEECIAYVMLHHQSFREAFQREGIYPDDGLLTAMVKKGEEERARRDRMMLMSEVRSLSRL